MAFSIQVLWSSVDLPMRYTRDELFSSVLTGLDPAQVPSRVSVKQGQQQGPQTVYQCLHQTILLEMDTSSATRVNYDC